jgi:hypothetical protein
MDANLLIAVATSVTTAASIRGVAITALVLNSRHLNLIDKQLDRIDIRLGGIESRLNEIALKLH